MGCLDDKVAVISGGATGIGAAMARRFATEGASIAVLDVNAAAASALVSELKSCGHSAVFIACDMADTTAVQVAVDDVADKLGGIDMVCANAGIGTKVIGGTVETIEPEQWDHAFGVNTGGVYALCRAALPHLRRHGGSIVLTSSIFALVGVTQRPTHAYAASKGALLSLTRAMAATYGPDAVRVNALAPGIVRTALTDDIISSPEQFEPIRRTIPLRRYALPEEIAACALFLASDEASFVSGAVLVVDGGQTIT